LGVSLDGFFLGGAPGMPHSVDDKMDIEEPPSFLAAPVVGSNSTLDETESAYQQQITLVDDVFRRQKALLGTNAARAAVEDL
jgi:hypothetical protein